MNKLLTFGCSFTNYRWPTWADYLGKQYKSFVNHGRIGAGNEYIFQTLCKQHAIGNITADDTVAIMWSTTVRYDYYKDNDWVTRGNVYNSGYSKEFIDNFVDPIGYYIRDCCLIHGAKQLLENVGCKYVFFSLTPLNHPIERGKYNFLKKIFKNDIVDKYEKIYKSTIDIILPSVYEVVFNSDWNSRVEELEYVLGGTYEIHAGPDWPSWEAFANGIAVEPSEEILLDMCERLGATTWKEIIDHKLWMCKDYHPTPKMHVEYLDKVLPDWRTWD